MYFGYIFTSMPSKKQKVELPTVVGRWRHRIKDGRLPEPVKRLDFPPHGIIANRIRIKPQPYPLEIQDCYFKVGKYFSLVYKGKIGSYEQWSNATGIPILTLRERINSGRHSMDEVMSKTPLNITDHSKDRRFAEKYCRCKFCLKARVKEWEESLSPYPTDNPQDKGAIFERNDLSKFILYKNKILSLEDLARKLKMDYQTLHARIFRYGWTLEKTFNTPVRKKRSSNE